MIAIPKHSYFINFSHHFKVKTQLYNIKVFKVLATHKPYIYLWQSLPKSISVSNLGILNLLPEKAVNRIEHTNAKKHSHHITACKVKCYISLNFKIFVHVTILTPICMNFIHLFALIHTPIITIE